MLTIRIEGPIDFGPSWPALQAMIRSFRQEWETGIISRISRRDGQANYRARSGAYDLEFIPETGDAVTITLLVNLPGI